MMIYSIYDVFQKCFTLQSIVTNTVDLLITTIAVKTLCESDLYRYTILGLGALSVPICALCAFQSFCFSVSLLYAPSWLSLLGAAYWGAATTQVIFTLPEFLASVWILAGPGVGEDRSFLYQPLIGYMFIAAAVRGKVDRNQFEEKGLELLFQNLIFFGNMLDCIYLAITSMGERIPNFFQNLSDDEIDYYIKAYDQSKDGVIRSLMIETKQLHGQWSEDFSWFKSLHFVATGQAKDEDAVRILEGMIIPFEVKMNFFICIAFVDYIVEKRKRSTSQEGMYAMQVQIILRKAIVSLRESDVSQETKKKFVKQLTDRNIENSWNKRCEVTLFRKFSRSNIPIILPS